jgi:hypothetical protein
MPQQLLHRFEFCPDTSEQSRVRVPERVPSESLLNSETLRDRTNILAQDRLAPDRLPATVSSAGKNPIVALGESGAFSPFRERL